MNAFGLYIHWPFCVAKCPYCDFNSHVRPDRDEAAWCDGILKEMKLVATLQGDQRPKLDTIFFGGGTPSLMQGKTVAAVIEQAARCWTFADDIEITLESNPASADAGRFADYKTAGVNRLSLGIQSFDPAALTFLGRVHGVDEARAALKLAISTFDRVSFDLIYARPGQTEADWRAELSEAFSYGTEHLSLYELTVEPVTPFATMLARGTFEMPSEDTAATLYNDTQEAADAANMPAYEISNHARPGCECHHNLIYWRYGAYAGLGPGAHGRLDVFGRRFATANERRPERWLEKIATKDSGFATMEEILPDQGMREHLLMNLRLREGVDIIAFRDRWGGGLPDEKIIALADLGLVAKENGRLAATPYGRLVLNRLIEELTV
jgi:putative oxygen-independent coproporphyrinogen III oxidase